MLTVVHGIAVLTAALAALGACGPSRSRQAAPEQSSDQVTATAIAATTTASPSINAAQLVERMCASCHLPQAVAASRPQAGSGSDHDVLGPGAIHVPTLEALHAFPVGAIVASLEHGTMRGVGAKLSGEERIAIAEHLSGGTYDPRGPTGLYCPPEQNLAPGSDAQTTAWSGWGNDLGNMRFQPGAKITAADVGRLQPKWSFALTPGRAGSVIVAHGSRLYFGDQSGKVRSVDRETGCTHWVFDAGRWVRTSVHVVTADTRQLACFGVTQYPANFICVDAATGERVWEAELVDHPMAYVSAASAYHDGVFYVPLSVGQESHRAAPDPKYECCTGRGALVAVEASTGKIKWRSFMTPEPKPTQVSEAGTQLWGPSGASIWKAPVVDVKLSRLYVTTGQNSSLPATKTADALVAVDMATGKIVWAHQMTAGDVWNGGCLHPDGRGAKANCPFTPIGGIDLTTPLLTARPKGGRMLLVADKKSRVVALDPDRNGKMLWQTKLSPGGFWGGVQWGMAADDKHVYVPLHDRFSFGVSKLGYVGGGKSDPDAGALVALRLADGKEVWRVRPPAESCIGKPKDCAKALSQAPAVIPGVVFATSLDGHVRAYDTANGKLLWDYDTTAELKTVGGANASGGSMDGPGGVIVAGDMVFLSSGYGAYMTMPGNLLLAFSVDGK